MTRVRPSLRKLEKAERAATGSAYAAHRAAMTRIEARLSAALDRIVVAAEFSEFSGSTVAQLQHARRFIQHGRDDHEAVGDACVYGWDEWQALDDDEREAQPCDCETFDLLHELVA